MKIVFKFIRYFLFNQRTMCSAVFNKSFEYIFRDDVSYIMQTLDQAQKQPTSTYNRLRYTKFMKKLTQASIREQYLVHHCIIEKSKYLAQLARHYTKISIPQHFKSTAVFMFLVILLAAYSWRSVQQTGKHKTLATLCTFLPLDHPN